MADPSDVIAIKNWLSKQPHLPNDVEDILIKRFLLSCGNSLERVKSTMSLFFTLRADTPEFFSNRDPDLSHIQEAFSIVDQVFIPSVTPNGYRCILIRLANKEPERFNLNNVIKTLFLIGDTRFLTEDVFPKGEVIIFDMEGFSFKHLTRFNPPSVRKYLQYTQEALPVRLKQIHIINVSPILDRIMTLIKPFLKSEVMAMLHLHLPNSTTLGNFIPAELLPKEYGGGSGYLKDILELWQAKMLERKTRLRELWKADIAKRPDQKINRTIMEGSFRSLIID